MKVIETITEMQQISNEQRKSGKSIALIPTMGYLHDGHCSLIRHGKVLADVVITTHFVNPTQFAPNEDFEKYPRDFERDCTLAESNGTDYLFHPSVSEMYPNDFNTEIKVSGISDKFEGKTRPAHFKGVATVVSKLLNATVPDFALFGQKDYQQYLVIKQMVSDLNFPVNIILHPTKREEDGLAMSSRNVYLSDEERMNATILFRALSRAKATIINGELNRQKINSIMADMLITIPGVKIDYASAAEANTLEEPENFNSGQSIVLLIACRLGKTRLIDNMVVNSK
ncbi:MAG: pantoate--beta-alanine ligase [bacterium]